MALFLSAGGTGNWNTALGWTQIPFGNGVPGLSDTAIIAVAGSTVDVSDMQFASILDIGGSNVLLDLTSSGSFLFAFTLADTTGNIDVASGAVIDTVNAALTGSGVMTLSNGTFWYNAALLDQGFTIKGTGSIGTVESYITSGSLGGGTIDASGGLLTVNGYSDAGTAYDLTGAGADLEFTGTALAYKNIDIGAGQSVEVGPTGTLDILVTEAVAGGEIKLDGGTLTAPTIDLSSPGSTIIGFGTIDTDITGPGTVEAVGGTLDVTLKDPTQANYSIMDDGSTLELSGPVGSASIIHFDSTPVSGNGTFFYRSAIDAGEMQGTLDNFVAGTTLEVFDNSDFIYTATYGGGKIHLFDPAHNEVASISDLNNPGSLTVHQLGGGLVDITASALPCFLRGTAILTPHGEMPVELLEVGDHVTTLSGERKRLRWIGVGRTLVTPLNRERCAPVVVRRGALGENVPHRDLYITRGHSLFIDGYLVPAEELINHRSIAWVEESQVVEFYHLELDDHDVVMAEGAAAESYREDQNDALFFNTDTRPSQRVLEPCAEILHYGPELKRIWQEISDRAGIDPAIETTGDPDLHLVVDGVRVDASSIEGRVFRFELDAVPASLRIASRRVTPSALGFAQDQRTLGVALRQVILASAGTSVRIGWDGQMIDGFNNPEPAEQHCWTTGDAGIAPEFLAPFKGALTVELHVSGVSIYALPETREALAA